MPHVQYASWDICYKQHKFKISCYHSIVVYCGYRAYHRISKASKVDLGHLCYPFGVCILWIVVWGALITAPVYPIVSNLQIAVGADTSETESYIFRQFQYGVQLPIYAIFVYLVSCWGVFIFKNIGRVFHSHAVLMTILLFLLYLLPLCTYGPFAPANDKWKCLDKATPTTIVK